MQKVFNDRSYAQGAEKSSADFRLCSGTAGAADFIENAPHASNGIDIVAELNQANGKFQTMYWMIAMVVMILFGLLASWKFVWIIGVAAGVLSSQVGKAVQKRNYQALIDKYRDRN